MPINDKLTVKEFAQQTGLTESYVRSLICEKEGSPPAIPTECPVPGMKRPRLIDRSHVDRWRQPRSTGRPRTSRMTA